MPAFTMRASTLRSGDLLRAATVTTSPTAILAPATSITLGGIARTMLTIVRGDTTLLLLSVAGLSALGLAGASLWFTVKRQLSDPDSVAVLQKTIGNGITIIGYGNATTPATALITVQPADTAALMDVQQLFLFDVQLLDANGVKTTLVSGYLTILPDITQA